MLREVPTSWTRLCVLQQHSPFSKVLAVGLRSTPQTTQVMKRTQKWTKCGVQVQYELDWMMFWHSCIRQVNVNTFFVAQLRAKRKLLHVWTMNIDCSWFFTSARSKFCFQICVANISKTQCDFHKIFTSSTAQLWTQVSSLESCETYKYVPHPEPPCGIPLKPYLSQVALAN